MKCILLRSGFAVAVSAALCMGLVACGDETAAPPDEIEVDGVVYGLTTSEAYLLTDRGTLTPPPPPPYCEGVLYSNGPVSYCVCTAQVLTRSGPNLWVSPDGTCPATYPAPPPPPPTYGDQGA